ncbi:MAG: glycosyltransferase family 4 protein [Candidatus Helarchaeota archaeon]
MKVLLIPELDWITALRNRVHKIFHRLSKKHEIHVIYFEHQKRGITKSYRLNAKIYLHKIPTHFFQSMLCYYIINSALIYASLLQLIQAYHIDVIVTTNFVVAPLAIHAARKKGIPIVFDVVDFQPYHIYYLKALPAPLKRVGGWILRGVLDHTITSVNEIITTGLPLLKYIKQKRQMDGTIISNGVNRKLFHSNYNPQNIQERYKLTSPTICFIGALEYWIDYDYLFKGLFLLGQKYPRLHCLFIGPSRHYGLRQIKQIAKKYRVLDRVIFTGERPYHELPQYICASDVCVLPFLKNYLTECAIPMKIFEYLACERPVVSVPLAGVRSIAKDTIFYAETPQEFANVVQRILNDPQLVRDKVKKGKELTQNYEWDSLARQYETVLKKLIAARNSSI